MDLRLLFNEDVLNYDKMRPTYVKALFDDIISFSSLDSNKAALEIGIGTGQATLPFLNTGCRVTAVELGKELADFSKAKFSEFTNFEIINGAFESVELEENFFDLIYAATAFHWIEQESGYTKAYRLLKSGGTLALFWNHPAPPDDELNAAMQKVYDKYKPASQDSSRVHKYSEENCLEIVSRTEQYGFVDVNYKIYCQTRAFDADSYIALLNTYSDHRAMPRDKWALFEKELREAISKCGGQVYIHDTMDLYLAKKP